MSHPPEIDLSLPYITDELEGVGGKIRARPENFVVDEIPLYEPTGTGHHLYINITKTNLTTRDVQLQLADLFQLRPQNIGTAGLKDKYAVTTQTFSVLLKNRGICAEEAVKRIEDRIDVKVNWARFHDNKLRAGHLIGNRFKVIITDIQLPRGKAFERATSIADAIHKWGVPNYYGEQRIGDDGAKIRDGWEILHGEKTFNDRWLSKLLVATYQSYLCNRYIAERVRRGLFSSLLLGDIAKKHETGGIFWVNDVNAEQSRYDAKEISFTAPIYGYKMSKPFGESAVLEAEIFERAETSMDAFKKMKITGTRRFGRLTPSVEVTENNLGLQLSFLLHKGGFATTLLREFMKNEPE